jgi:hypothetical protein
MSRFLKELEARQSRTKRLLEAMRELEAVESSYAFQAGFYQSQLMTLAADAEASTDQLIRDIRQFVAKKQQPAMSA